MFNCCIYFILINFTYFSISIESNLFADTMERAVGGAGAGGARAAHPGSPLRQEIPPALLPHCGEHVPHVSTT